MPNRTLTNTTWSPQHFSQWLEVALAATNLAVSGWFVWATRSAPGQGPPRGGQSIGRITTAYLLEVLVLGLLVLLALLGERRQGARWLGLLWGCLGALAGLSVLGAWSIGAALLPSLFLVLAAGSLAAVRVRVRLSQLFVWSLAGLGCQLGLMLLVIAAILAASPRP